MTDSFVQVARLALARVGGRRERLIPRDSSRLAVSASPTNLYYADARHLASSASSRHELPLGKPYVHFASRKATGFAAKYFPVDNARRYPDVFSSVVEIRRFSRSVSRETSSRANERVGYPRLGDTERFKGVKVLRERAFVYLR